MEDVVVVVVVVVLDRGNKCNFIHFDVKSGMATAEGSTIYLTLYRIYFGVTSHGLCHEPSATGTVVPYLVGFTEHSESPSNALQDKGNKVYVGHYTGLL